MKDIFLQALFLSLQMMQHFYEDTVDIKPIVDSEKRCFLANKKDAFYLVVSALSMPSLLQKYKERTFSLCSLLIVHIQLLLETKKCSNATMKKQQHTTNNPLDTSVRRANANTAMNTAYQIPYSETITPLMACYNLILYRLTGNEKALVTDPTTKAFLFLT